MVRRILAAALLAGMLCSPPALAEPALYEAQPGVQTRWVSPENPAGAKGQGGRENRGAKGHAFDTIKAGKAHVLADIRGAGVIDRMWMTIEDRSPEMLRGLKLEIFWDGASTPAVAVPLGDFFAHGAGEMKPMETALLASPEGRSFVSYIPMPFRKGARIVVTNETGKDQNLIFFDINYRAMRSVPKNALYFHAWWSRDRATTIGEAFAVLPRIEGRGRFLGTSMTVLTNPAYGKTWWGEGEARIFLDGDGEHPTLVGTGVEDYIGTAWGQGAYINRFQGAPVADEPSGRWTFYRFHVPDPVLFERDIEVRVQQIGGAPKADVMRLQAEGVPLLPVTVDPGRRDGFAQLLAGETPRPLTDPALPTGWTNFYRSDDVAAVAYFYLDRPETGLAPLPPAARRREGFRAPTPAKP